MPNDSQGALGAEEFAGLLRGCMSTAVRLAITRHNLELDPDAASEEDIADDAAGACFGEECCDDKPISEVVQLLAYAQSLKQAAPPQAESPKDEVDYNECCCEDGYKMICPQHGAPQTLAVGHGVEMADDCAHRALDRLGVPRDGKGLYLRMQWLKDQIPKPIYPQYGTNSQTSEDYVRACEAQGIGPNILALTGPVADPSKEELKAECEMLREELCYHRDYWAEWNMRALTAQAQKEELKAALGQARDYVVGLSAYLATCATVTIFENLETTITSLHKERDYLERLLSGDGKEKQ